LIKRFLHRKEVIPINILVTGGSGYIGSVLVPALIAARHNVKVMDLVPPVAGEVIIRDICLHPMQPADLKDIDLVIHLAAVVGDEACHVSPARAVETNYLATKYLAHACQQASVRLFFTSTCSVYGVKRGISTELTEPEPYSVYGLTKLAAEKDVINARGTVFRLATVYGFSPRMSYILVINEMIRLARETGTITIFGGEQVRPFVKINSLVQAFLAALPVATDGEIINIVDENITLGALGELIGRIFNCKIITRPEIVDRRSYEVVNAQAIRLLAFRSIPLEEGLIGCDRP
jgi:nucleoside-diphosphate-sugar epimerase